MDYNQVKKSKGCGTKMVDALPPHEKDLGT